MSYSFEKKKKLTKYFKFKRLLACFQVFFACATTLFCCFKQPSTLVIIAISPKYKADTDECPTDSHALHTKYIHNMMQNEFIQEGCLNFRFIPVLFLGASQNVVPGWLQNTRVYRWPQDTEDLLLRLFRVERYIPPPVPAELALIPLVTDLKV
uniref:SEFIR domain-containing protein n=1 Tax=Oryzias melastigma TaxID=30732 RepID=A0A3B3DHW8_ORYME